MLIADRAALLLLDAGGRRLLPARAARGLLAGALLAELVLEGRVDADPGSGALRVLPGQEAAPRLAAALAVVAARPTPAARCVRALAARPLWEEALAALAGYDALREARTRRLLLWSSVRWPVDAAVADPVREAVRTALAAAGDRSRARAVDPGTASLVLLLSAAGCLRGVVPGLPAEPDPDEAAAALGVARRLPGAAREALEDVDAAVAALARSAP
ncbi:GPP34 family phosphoprotein, partial [Kineococcus glutinatus]|uniref:GPP34 family phosphoprotein n=1 Tax=Kineococcus glutinatus TaxID=1070872 RepID=UPI0031ECC5FE